MDCIPQPYACYKQSAIVKCTLQSIRVCWHKITFDPRQQRTQKLMEVIIPLVSLRGISPFLAYVQSAARTFAFDLIVEVLQLVVVPSVLLLQCLIDPSTILLLFDAFKLNSSLQVSRLLFLAFL